MSEMMKKVLTVAGARPNFVKIAPLIEAMHQFNEAQAQRLFHPILIHTGQHYDFNMSDSFFQDLEIPKPDIFLGVRSGSHAAQTAKIMLSFEKVCQDENPDLVLVVGDVNSTLACALVASKMEISVAHVEGGLRSFDRSMPEEINRVVTDALSDHLFVSERSSVDNLLDEGKRANQIYFVGNVMIDTLFKYRQKAKQSSILRQLSVFPKTYGVVTLHRPSNVDFFEIFQPIMEALVDLSRQMPLFFSVHPRTGQQIKTLGFDRYFSVPPVSSHGLYWLDPLGYLDFLCLMDNARLVLTDSGGIQEETSALGIPCLTLRENTERPITTTQGTNRVIGVNPEGILLEAGKIIEKGISQGRLPELWDGKTAPRIVEILHRVR